MLSKHFKRKKDTKKGKKELFKSKAEKTVELAFSPEEQAKEMIRTIGAYERWFRKMLEKIKNVFKWLWGNKQSIVSILYTLGATAVLNYTVYSDLLLGIEFFATHLVIFQVVVGILTGLGLLVSVFSICNKCGIENLQEIAHRLEEKKLAKESKLSPELRKDYKNQLSFCKKEIKNFDNKIKDFNSIISNFNFINNIGGFAIDEETKTKYNNALTGVEEAQAKKKQYEEKSIVLEKVLKRK